MINKRIHETSPFDKVFYLSNRNLITFLYKLSICYLIPNLIFHLTTIKPISHERLDICKNIIDLIVNNLGRFQHRVSVQGVKSLCGHFAHLCRGFEFYEVKKFFFAIIFQKQNGNTFTLLIIFIVKSLQKEQNSTNLLL